MKTVNWAIIAPGNIARSFAAALNSVEAAVCYSVAGRSLSRAEEFAKEFGFQKAYGDIDVMLQDPTIDVVYIAAPHNVHYELSLKCLRAGKAVLCEKPMAINAKQASEIFELARSSKLFYMEAVWTRFLPVFSQVREWLGAGLIGDVQLVQSSFGINVPFDPKHRLYNPALAGGSILDLGIYPVTLADWVYNTTPQSIQATGHIGQTGIDESTAATLNYGGNRIAQIHCSMTSLTNIDAWIVGTKGRIYLDTPFHGCEKARLLLDDEAIADKTAELPHNVNGYEYEIAEVQRCLKAELTESPDMSWETSTRVLNVMDELRSQVGVSYDFE